MTSNRLQCPARVAPETLSAWHDNLVPPSEAQQLRAHVASCPACRATMAQLDWVGHAMRTQRHMEPGDRVWNGVHRELLHGTPRRPPARRGRRALAFGSLGAVAAVLLVVVGIVALLGRQGGLGQGPLAHGTPAGTAANGTPSTSATAGSTANSTALTPAQAWGSAARVTQLSTDLGNGSIFQANAIAPDGTKLFGVRYTPDSSLATCQAPPSGGGDPCSGAQMHASAGYLDVATHAFISIGVTTLGNTPPDCCKYDGRYVVAGAYDSHGNEPIWAYDTQTQQLSKIASSTSYSGVKSAILDHGTVILTTGDGLHAVSLDTGQSTRLSTGVDQPIAISFAWPLVVYTGQSGGDYHLYDVSKGTDTSITSFSSLVDSAHCSVPSISLAGNTLYAAVHTFAAGTPSCTTLTSWALYSLPSAQPTGATPHLLMRTNYDAGSPSDPNSTRALLMGGYVYDIALDRMVALYASGERLYYGEGAEVGQNNPPAALAGNFVAKIQFGELPPGANTQTTGAPETVTIYDLSEAPGA